MNKDFMNSVTRGINRFGLTLKKHSPEILLVAGVVGGVVSAVMACKATTKFSSILEEPKDQLDQMRDYVEKNGYTEKYTEQDHKKDIALVYAHTCWDIAKLYGPSVILGAASVTCILASHNIIRQRNAALAAAYTAVDSTLKDYRKNVRDRFGEKLDQELRYNIKSKEVEETVINEDGSEQIVKKTIETAEEPKTHDKYSKFARPFDDRNENYENDAEFNLSFLLAVQNQMNDLLKTRGHVFLNEVYDALGFQRSRAGQVVGWVYDEVTPVGDNYIDFGIHDLWKEGSRDFVSGYEKFIMLDFNVDGVVLELLQ